MCKNNVKYPFMQEPSSFEKNMLEHHAQLKKRVDGLKKLSEHTALEYEEANIKLKLLEEVMPGGWL
jgi:hypothetical protein